jgi:hypothetical protein
MTQAVCERTEANHHRNAAHLRRLPNGLDQSNRPSQSDGGYFVPDRPSQVSERPEIARRRQLRYVCRMRRVVCISPARIVLADFGEFLGWFADRTILLMKNHPLLGSVSLVSCLLLNFRGQASRCVKQTTPTGRQLGLFAASHCYYVMLVKSEVFQARHVYLDAAFKYSVPRVSLRSKNVFNVAKSRAKKRAPTEARAG